MILKKKTNIYKEYKKSKKSSISRDNIKKISVVIPNYNYEKYIEERIDSVLFQTYPIYELIIIDDKSTDNSVELINRKIEIINKKYPHIKTKFIINKKNSGNVFIGWQKAFELSTGDYLWIAEADDSCNNFFLENIMKGFDDSETIISYCESLTVDEKNIILMNDLRIWIDIFNCKKWDNNYIIDGKDEITSTLCINNTIANVSSVVFKKISNVNYNDYLKKSQTFRLAGDWYFYYEILKYGKIAYCSDSLNYHRMQKKSVTLTTSGQKEFEEICRIQDIIMNEYKLSDEVKNKVYTRRENERRRFGIE